MSTTSESPDLRLPVGAIGAVYLRGTPMSSLVIAGRADEERAGSADRATSLLGVVPGPWCPLDF